MSGVSADRGASDEWRVAREEPLATRPSPLSTGSAATWRLPGCDDRCQTLAAILPGSRRHVMAPIHDPEAHESYGATLQGLDHPHLVETGPLLIDLRLQSAHLFGARMPLSGREWQLLALLGAARGGICSIRDIVRSFWPEDEGVVSVSSAHTVRVMVGRVRARFGLAHDLIATDWTRGYFLQMAPPGGEIPPAPPRPWAWRYPACLGCGTTEHRHEGHGYCTVCKLKGRPTYEQPQRDSAGRFIAASNRDSAN